MANNSGFDAGGSGAPAAPTLTSAAGSDSMTVSWTAPNDNGSAITDYDVVVYLFEI